MKPQVDPVVRGVGFHFACERPFELIRHPRAEVVVRFQQPKEGGYRDEEWFSDIGNSF